MILLSGCLVRFLRAIKFLLEDIIDVEDRCLEFGGCFWVRFCVQVIIEGGAEG